jgi:hypothetical protein
MDVARLPSLKRSCSRRLHSKVRDPLKCPLGQSQAPACPPRSEEPQLEAPPLQLIRTELILPPRPAHKFFADGQASQGAEKDRQLIFLRLATVPTPLPTGVPSFTSIFFIITMAFPLLSKRTAMFTMLQRKVLFSKSANRLDGLQRPRHVDECHQLRISATSACCGPRHGERRRSKTNQPRWFIHGDS